MDKRMQMVRAILLTLLMSVAVAPAAFADTFTPTGSDVDPPLFIFPDAACEASGGCAVFGGEVNALGSNQVLVQDHQPGGGSLASTLLLLIGVPNKNNTNYTAPAILTVSPGSGQLGGSSAYLGTWGPINGFAGSLTSGFPPPPNSAYQVPGMIDNGNSSENFTNWHAADSAVVGINATSFGIFIYKLNTTMSGGTTTTIDFGGSGLLPGTFVVAYGCSANGVQADGSCKPPGNVYSTPFTKSGGTGLVTPPIPEPATLALFGTGLIGMAGLLRRRLGRKK